MVLDGRAVKAVDFVEESTFATFPTDPTMLGFGGYVNPVSIKKSAVYETFPYLKAADSANRLQSTQKVKASEAFEATIELRPTDWTILPYILCAATVSTYAVGDNVYDIAMGVRVGDEYETLNGGCFSKYEFSVEEEKSAVAKITAMFAETSGYGGTDYVGLGSHPGDPSGDALAWEDITSVQYDSAALSTVDAHLDSLKFAIDYSVKPIKDLGTGNNSHIGGWAFFQRDISLELGLSIDEMDLAADLLDGSAHTFKFTGLSKTFTFSNCKWEGDWDQKLDADDLVGMTLKSSHCDLAIA